MLAGMWKIRYSNWVIFTRTKKGMMKDEKAFRYADRGNGEGF